MPVSSPPVIDEVASALSVASLRHRVIANNIANVNTQGYQRMKLSFDRAFAADADAPAASSLQAARIVPEKAAAVPTLEQDMVSLSSNTMNYSVLAKMLGRYFAIVSTITGSGRG